MCQTRISNLWTTAAALSKLPSLVDLRFQNWLCCSDGESCVASSSVKSNKKIASSKPNRNRYFGGLSVNIRELLDQNLSLRNMVSLSQSVVSNEVQSMSEDSSDDSEAELCNHQQEYDNMEPLSNAFPEWDEHVDLLNEVTWAAFKKIHVLKYLCGATIYE